MSDASPIKITSDELAQSEDDRFARFKLIGWWDQARLANARVLVVGAGALGNEIIKNLALLGVGNVLIADRDRIEASNLSRSVLYRAKDIGQSKAAVAARAARELFPEMNVYAFDGDVVNTLGAGVFRWADLIIGGLDNRETRLFLNRQSWRLGKPWIDGAIEQIQGVARVFVPDAAQTSPCYECTMSSRDWQLLAQRRSCNMLTLAQMEGGKTPTTPTISAIIAGIQTQEAVKLLHGMDSIAGRGLTFVGATTDCFPVTYQRRADCLSHETYAEVIDLAARSDELTFGELLDAARSVVGPSAVVELNRDIVARFDCPSCGTSENVFAPLGGVGIGRAECATCGNPSRTPVLFHHITGTEPFLNRTLRDSGIPAFDVVGARGDRLVGLALAGDSADILGPLDTGGLSWT